MAHVLDAALKVADASVPQLDSGLADQLRLAAAAQPLFIPSVSSDATNGTRWLMLAQLGGLDPGQTLALGLWLEQAYSAEVAARFNAGLPTVPSLPSPSAAHSLALAPAPAPAPAPPPPTLPTLPIGGSPGAILGLAALLGSLAPPSTHTVPSASGPLGSAPAMALMAHTNLSADIAEQGMSEAEFPIATFTLHTTRTPPAGTTELRYGFDVVGTKAFRNLKSAGASTLTGLCEDTMTTMVQLNTHFLAAASTLRQAGLTSAAERLTQTWMDLQTHVPSPALIRLYLKE